MIMKYLQQKQYQQEAKFTDVYDLNTPHTQRVLPIATDVYIT